MTKLNQFESAFLAADKSIYDYDLPEFPRVLVVTDLEQADSEAFADRVQQFLSVLDAPSVEWSVLRGDAFHTVGDLLRSVEEFDPALVVTYRHLHSDAWKWPHSLGEHLDVLTQVSTAPVLVLPHPDAGRALPHTVNNTHCVMAITDQLTGDDRLVNTAVRLTQPGGVCWLTHIESAPALDRIMDAIAKIPEIDTGSAAELIERQLLREPRDYIARCRQVIQGAGSEIEVDQIVRMGRHLDEYRRLVEEHRVDLLVLNTLDGDQLAMNGRAYPLAVELRGTPLLML